MEIPVPAPAKNANYSVAPIRQQFDYFSSYTSIIKTFTEKVKDLETERDEMQLQVTDVRSNGEEIADSVIKWLNDVNAFLVESNKFLKEGTNATDANCIKGLLPNLCSRYQLRKKVEKKMKDMEALMKRKNFTQISKDVQPPSIEFTIDEDFVPFDSRKKIADEIWTSLKSDDIQMIGIYGMPGVGKTNLVAQIGKQAESSNFFDVILTVVVSQNPDILHIQDRFVGKIRRTKFHEKTTEGRASQLHKILETRLEEGKKILVILDDVWEKVKMSDLGIPFSYDDSKFQKSCKIVVASRDERLCLQMGCQKIHKVEPLNQNEAWSLFEKIVDHDILTMDRRNIASQIIKACGGLPLAINIIASMLRNNNSLDCWKDAVSKITRANLDRRMFTVLQLSYKFLEKESDAQELFLLCSLFREDADIPIYDLLIYGLGWGLFQDTTTLELAFMRVNARVEYLKSSSLLLEGTKKEFVKIHDIVREYALSVAHKDQHMFCVEAGSKFDNLASTDSLKLCTSISLLINDAANFPSKLELPELKILKLERGFNCPSLVLPYDMIAPMQKLKVLSMYGIQIMALPPAFKYFQELHTLSFDSCEIEDISIIGELNNLFFLCFRGCNIKALPEEIGKLTKLKILDLSKCEELTLVLSNVISSLSRLEGLLIGYFKGWAVSTEDNRNNYASLEDLKSLSNLVLLEVHIPDIELWPEDLLFENLTRFKISVGGNFETQEQAFGSSKILKLKDVIHSPLKKGVDDLLQTAEIIYMQNMNNFQNGLYEQRDVTCFLELKCLHIKDLNEMKYLADATIAKGEVFPRLEILTIRSLAKLEEINHGDLLGKSFGELQELSLGWLPQLMSILKSPAESAPLQNLRTLTVWGCHKLKSIFSQSMVRNSLQLVDIKVEDCEALEEIVDYENELEVSDIVFHQLRFLWLSGLPNLKSFLSSANTLAEDNHQAPCIRMGLFQQVAFPKLELLVLKNMHSLREIWSNPSQLELSFPQLKSLYLIKLPNLMHVLDMDSCETICFQSLNILDISSCPKMEVVATIKENATALIKFPYLQSMSLRYLSNFQGFHTERSTLFDGKVAFPKLENLELKELGRLRAIWTSPPQVKLSFLRLKRIDVSFLPNLMHVWDVGSCETIRFSSLRILEISYCPMMEVVAKIEENVTPLFEFPCLQHMVLRSLSNLKGFHTERFALFDEKVSFPKLENLELKQLDNFKEIWTCSSQVELSFFRLKELNISSLPNLMHVWNMGSCETIRFRSLSILKISYCEMMEVVTKIKENTTALIEFLCLQHMVLYGLSNFKGFLMESSALFDEKVSFPALAKLDIYEMKDLTEIWSMQLPPGSFHELKDITVCRCDKLRSVIPLNLLHNIQSLRQLIVTDCKTVKEIIGDAGGGLEHAKVLTPHLEFIKLAYLPMLKSFCHHSCDFECPTLSTVNLECCYKIETFTCGDLKTPMLKFSRVDWVKHFDHDLNTIVQYASQERHKDDNNKNDGDKSDDRSNQAIDSCDGDKSDDKSD